MPSKVLEVIARENFRSSGYITHPRNERPVSWTFSKPPSSPSFYTTDAVRGALRRRERALTRQQAKPTLLQSCLNALFHR